MTWCTKANLVAFLQKICYEFWEHGSLLRGALRIKSVSLKERFALGKIGGVGTTKICVLDSL